MGQKINIPSQNQPFRKQSSLGGDVSFRNLNGTNDNSFITLAKVTKVYYKQGKLDFKLTNTVSIVQEQGGDGSGSAPIPVDFFGRKPDGQVFGHYRPVKVGDLIAIAYINGHRSNPIVIGVYPDSAPDYEMISPSMFETGDDNNSGIAETGLAEQKVYPSMQTSYRSGSGTIAEALNGHSFLILDDETANQYDQLWTDYESVGFFNHNGETTNPLKEEAGSWLLVHEDNPDGDGDGHRTRFYVNPKGEIQIVLMGSDSEGDVAVLEGSRKDGFTLKHYNDLSSIKAGDKGQDVYNPDFDVAKKYVELNIGKDQSILMQAVDQGFSGGNTSLTVKPDGVYLNDKPLNANITDSIKEHSKELADAISKDLTTTKEWQDFDQRVTQAGKDAKDAGDKARQAGEDAKQAGISAEKAGENAKAIGDDIKRHIIYYASAFPQGDHYIPGKYLAINTETYIANGIIKSAMIEDGAIDNAKIANEAVGSSQIEDLAVTRGKLAYMAVGTAQIEDLAVSDEKVDHLSFNHMEGELLDASKIRVRNLSGDSISAKTLTADKLIINNLGDITDKLGTIVDGNIIVKGNGKNSGVTLDGLDADNPDVYTPSKKAILVNIVRATKSSAEASLDYAKEVGLNNDPIAEDLQTKYDAMVSGLAPIFNDMSVSTNFDHNVVEKLTSDCNNAIDKFQNLANNQLNRKIGQTADSKNSVYQGYEQPANPKINDIWFQKNSDGTYQIKVYDGGSWISPGMQDIKDVQDSLQNLPRNYYQASEPTGNISAGSTWYKLEKGSNGNYTYTPYKWENKQWVLMLDTTSSRNYVGSAPSSPVTGDFWVDNNNTLKQYQSGTWVVVPTKGDRGIPGTPGADGRTSYFHVAYANSSDGSIGFTTSPNISSSYSYIGTYTDYTSTSSTNPSSYTWVAMFDSTKKRNFTTQPTTPYAVGDTWTQSGATYFCTTARDSGAFTASDWTMQQLNIHSLDSSVTNSLYNDNLLLGTENNLSVTGTNISNQTIHNYLLANGYNVSSLASTLGTQFTISFDWSVSGSSPSGTFNAQWSALPWDLDPVVTVSRSNTSGHISSTFSVSTDSKNVANAMGFRLDNFVGTLTVSNVKLEKGSISTPWCLSQSELTTTTGNYKGVTLNDAGLTATAGSTTVAMNSTDGFLINNAGGQVFHVDTSGNLTMKGNITGGDISGVNFSGNNLTLNNSMQVVNGNISANNGNFVIDSNGLTIKDGGLKIVNGNNETTTMIRDDGTFATNKGFFSGTITGSNIILNANDGSVINANGGAFKVDGAGNVTANSITITGNRKDNVNNLASLSGVSIYDGSVIEGSLIKGNTIIGGTVTSARFRSSGREIASGAYYPVSDSIYTPSYSTSEEGTINVHAVFPQAFSTVARIGTNKGVNAPYVNITNEAFDRNTASGSIGYGKGYEYPVPYLYGQQGGMPEYPVDSNEISVVWMNDMDQSSDTYAGYDGYKYTEIATVHDIVAKYASKKGRIKLNFGVVCDYVSHDNQTTGGLHNLYLILTTGRINGDDTYHVDSGGTTFNNIKNTTKIKMVSKKILTDVNGRSFYNLYAELSTQDLGPADVYYLGVLEKGFYKSPNEALNHTWKIQLDGIAVIPDSDLLEDQGYYIPYKGGSYRNLAVSGNSSIIAHNERANLDMTSEYNAEYITFSTSLANHGPYWTTINSDGIGFSIGDNSVAQDGGGNNIGLQTRQCIYFSGDTNKNGMSMDNFGNVHGQSWSGTWRVYNNQGDNIFDVPFDPNGVFNFYVPKVNTNTDPNHRWGGLKIGWVYFDQQQYRWAETVPAIYNTGGRVKGFAMFESYIISFVDGWCYQLASWWNNGVPNGVDSSKGDAQGTNTDAGHRGV